VPSSRLSTLPRPPSTILSVESHDRGYRDVGDRDNTIWCGFSAKAIADSAARPEEASKLAAIRAGLSRSAMLRREQSR